MMIHVIAWMMLAFGIALPLTLRAAGVEREQMAEIVPASGAVALASFVSFWCWGLGLAVRARRKKEHPFWYQAVFAVCAVECWGFFLLLLALAVLGLA